MKRFLVLTALLTSGSALAQEQLKALEVQALTRTAPTAASFTVTSGSTLGVSVPLMDVVEFRVSICAVNAGATLSGAGTLDAYLLDDVDGEVKLNKHLQWTVTSTTRCQVFPNQVAEGLSGYVMYAANAVTVSAGTTVTVRILAIRKRAK